MSILSIMRCSGRLNVKWTFRLSPNKKMVYSRRVTKLARLARKRSKIGMYYIMLRGIDKRNIFLHDEDKKKFLYYLFRAKELGGVVLIYTIRVIRYHSTLTYYFFFEANIASIIS